MKCKHGIVAICVLLPFFSFQIFAAEQDDCLVLSPRQSATSVPRLVPSSGHGDSVVTSIVASPQGNWAATAAWDGTVKLWDLESLAQLNSLVGHGDIIRGLDISPDSTRIATGSDDGSIRLWDASTGNELLRYTGFAQDYLKTVTHVKFLSDQHLIATGYGDVVRLLDISQCKVSQRIKHEGVASLSVSPDRLQILVGTERGEVHVYGFKEESLTLSETVVIPSPNLSLVQFHPLGGYLASGRVDDASVGVWRFGFGGRPPVLLLEADLDQVTHLHVSSDGRLLALSDNSSFVLYPLLYPPLYAPEKNLGFLHSTAIFPFLMLGDESCILIPMAGGLAKINASLDGLCQEGVSLGAKVSEVQLQKEMMLVTSGQITVWDMKTGRPVYFGEATGDELTVSEAVLLPDGDILSVHAENYESAMAREIDAPGLPDLFVKESLYGGERTILIERTCPVNNLRRLGDGSVVYSTADYFDESRCPPALHAYTVGDDDDFATLVLDESTLAKHFDTAQMSGDEGVWLIDDFVANEGQMSVLVKTDFGRDWFEWKVISNTIDYVDTRLTITNAMAPMGRKNMLVGSELEWDRNAAFIMDRTTGKMRVALPGHTTGVGGVLVDEVNKLAVTGGDDGEVRIWSVPSMRLVDEFKIDSAVSALAIQGNWLYVGGSDGGLRLFDLERNVLGATLFSADDGGWAVVAPDGRFDSNRFDGSLGMNWILPDEPFKPYPLEIFMREFYEPGLLSRLIARREGPPLPAIADLNRSQPRLEFIEVKANVQGRVDVRVFFPEFSNQSVYDLKLFRQGRLVARAPENGGVVRINDQGEVVFKNIALPSIHSGEVEFSAYAFNADRVRSQVVKHSYQPDRQRKPIGRRAFVLSIGVNSYENSAWNLQYAASDSSALTEKISLELTNSNEFSTVRIIELNDFTVPEEGKVYKTLIKAAFESLVSGESAPTPDDLLIITFAGHGFADPLGEYYLFPYDIGSGSTRQITDELYSKAISSSELDSWMLHVDAGEVVMILDACNSAASVEGEGFRPGPMGSRGLGQLAYDKKIRLLAATQAEGLAFESDKLKHGILTYALTVDALDAGEADFSPNNGEITIIEWLRYVVDRVPELFAKINNNTDYQPSRGVKLLGVNGMLLSEISAGQVQRPVLFDFEEGGSDTIIKNVQIH